MSLNWMSASCQRGACALGGRQWSASSSLEGYCDGLSAADQDYPPDCVFPLPDFRDMPTWLAMMNFFEDPFWVGLIEEGVDGRLRVGRHVFGAEPTNAQIFDFVLYCMGSIEICPTPGTAIPTRKFKNAKPKEDSPSEIYKAAISVANSEKEAEPETVKVGHSSSS
jgi:Protein of unknown function (DUF2992)